METLEIHNLISRRGWMLLAPNESGGWKFKLTHELIGQGRVPLVFLPHPLIQRPRVTFVT